MVYCMYNVLRLLDRIILSPRTTHAVARNHPNTTLVADNSDAKDRMPPHHPVCPYNTGRDISGLHPARQLPELLPSTSMPSRHQCAATSASPCSGTRDIAGFKPRLRTPSPVAFCPCSSGPKKESSHGPATMLSRESQHGNAVEPLSRPLCLLSGILPCCARQKSQCRGAQRLLGCRVGSMRRNLIACTVDTAPPKVGFHC